MTRLLLNYLLPLILPTLLFLLWAWFARRRQASGGVAQQLSSGPWFWLIMAGVVLAAGGLIYTALTHGGDPGGIYVAPRFEDGRVVPGRIE